MEHLQTTQSPIISQSNNDDTLEITIQGWLPDVPEATWIFRAMDGFGGNRFHLLISDQMFFEFHK